MSPIKKTRTIILSICSIASAGLTAMPAIASDVTFKFSDYELETLGGTQNLYERLGRKAHLSCTRIGTRSISVKLAEKVCEAETVESLVALISHPRLDQLHAQALGVNRYSQRR